MNPETVQKKSIQFDENLEKVKNALAQLETDIGLIQEGDGKNPYWNGKNAYQVISSCLTQVDLDKILLRNLDQCSNYLKSLIK